MRPRVLVADDSLTIQKVIAITLANSGYELVECVSEDDLLKKIQSEHFDLVLLDFNLSDSRSGYELSKQVHSTLRDAAIIVMLGTFDSIDEGQFNLCGISDKIVKPFESSKFIKKCAEILENNKVSSSVVDNSYEPSVADSNEKKFDELDSWKVNTMAVSSSNTKISLPQAELDKKNLISEEHLDPLTSEIKGWGFGAEDGLEEKFDKSFPPVIHDSSSEPSINVIEKLESSSRFVRDNFASFEDEVDEDETDASFQVPEDLNRNLLSEIENDVSAETFWAVDDLVPVEAEEVKDIFGTNLDDATEDLTEIIKDYRDREYAPDASQFSDEDVENSKNQSEKGQGSRIAYVDQDELVEKLKISLQPMIEEMVREFCRKNTEKIAWEVIPDLAENLIKKEIKEISDSIPH